MRSQACPQCGGPLIQRSPTWWTLWRRIQCPSCSSVLRVDRCRRIIRSQAMLIVLLIYGYWLHMFPAWVSALMLPTTVLIALLVHPDRIEVEDRTSNRPLPPTGSARS